MITDETVNTARKETFRYPTRLDSLHVNPLDGVDQKIKAIIAPFWADTQSESRFYKVNSRMITVTCKFKNMSHEGTTLEVNNVNRVIVKEIDSSSNNTSSHKH